MKRRSKENRENYQKLLDLLNEYPEFFNENEEGCPAEIVAEIKQVGKLLFFEPHEAKLALTVEEYQKLSDEGNSDVSIAGMHGVSKSTLINWKNRNGMVKGRTEPISIQTVITLYSEGKSQVEIARLLSTSQPYVSRILKKEGIR